MWCDLLGIKLNGSKTKTMIVSRLRTIYPQSTPLTLDLDRPVLKEFTDLDIIGLTFDAMMTFDATLCFHCCSSEAWYHE